MLLGAGTTTNANNVYKVLIKIKEEFVFIHTAIFMIMDSVFNAFLATVLSQIISSIIAFLKPAISKIV